MTRHVSTAVAVLFLALLPGLARADRKPLSSAQLFPTDGTVAPMNVSCRPSDGSRRSGSIHCNVHTVRIQGPPNAKAFAGQVTAAVIDFEVAQAKPERFKKYCDEIGSEEPPKFLPEVERTMLVATLAACRAGTYFLLLKLQLDGLRDVTAHQCSLFQFDWEQDFERVDDDTYVSNVGPSGLCNESVTETFHRDQKYDEWNYKQVVVKPAGKDKWCVEGIEVSEWSWLNYPTKLECMYWGR